MPVDPLRLSPQKLLEGTGEFLYAVRQDDMLEVVDIWGQFEVLYVIGSFLFIVRFSSILSVVTEHVASSASCAAMQPRLYPLKVERISSTYSSERPRCSDRRGKASSGKTMAAGP